MEIFGLSGGAILIAAIFAWWWSDSLGGFVVWLFVLGTCFGGAAETEVAQKVIHETKVVIEHARADLNPKPVAPVAPVVVKEAPEPRLEEPILPPSVDFGGGDFE
jgi:hypothetical protein